MKHESTLRRELTRVQAALKRGTLSPNDRAEQYGAQQAIEWALGRNACAPHMLAPKEDK